MTSDVSYGEFAYIYDALTDDVEYEKRAKYIKTLIQRHRSEKSTLLCDLGCGTGSMCRLLFESGFDVIGIDNSHAMLSVAAEKNTDGKILYLCQDMTDFELYGTVDVCTCLLDSINYVTDLAELDRMFALVNNYLNPGGIFIFDVNTIYKHREILANNTFVYDCDDVYCVWQNSLNKDDSVDISLDIFEYEDGAYYRSTEEFSEKAYPIDNYKKWLADADFEILHIYDEMSDRDFNNKTQRAVFVARYNGYKNKSEER